MNCLIYFYLSYTKTAIKPTAIGNGTDAMIKNDVKQHIGIEHTINKHLFYYHFIINSNNL